MKKRIVSAGLALGLWAGAGAANAAAYPSKPVSIVVPWAPGGTVDFVARQVAQKLTESMGQSFVVENRPGGAGTIGGGYVARSAPDGHTLMAVDGSYAIIPAVYKNLNWDPEKDLTGVSTMIKTPMVLVVPPTSQFKSVKELIDHAKSNPGVLNYGSGGSGSTTHVAAALFAHEAGIDLTHIPYKGGGEAMLAIMSGTVDLLFTASPSAMPGVRGGKARALGVSGTDPLSMGSDILPIRQQGLPSYHMDNWFGLLAPAGTPDDVIDALQKEIKQALADPKLQERLHEQGAEAYITTPDEFNDIIKKDMVRWIDLDKQVGIASGQ
ncbi:tripartite tricarboxylate transporter substrate binding protein [Pusillimonas sp. SM2304]|uniref:tripartite tricarboxylate transporter substrate binding protein n=1 Tax=Pusillimonas sp. SM2304 TaxID=3073241 RepID=UPI002874F43D|nr:tripartite tricarboxylate transporter substrate binding protein [Pusillimonas sp. SM2304]MDS1142460.1 tripartite tricarboxylate transporter substrate binding protein [Pusillimonas sp. SM2304]